jgi:hypothetical protein
MNEREYQELADSINELSGREAVTPKKLKNLVKKAKHIRKTEGTSALLQFASSLPHQFFTSKEIDRMQASPQYRMLSNKIIDLLISEGVVSAFEAIFMRKFV